MKEYKVKYVNLEDAEKTMNEMAKEGWRVVATSTVDNGLAMVKVMITFEK